MDQFDFDDEDADSHEFSCLGDESSPKQCPSSNLSYSSITANSSGSPLRGRTRNRRTRKVILSGAQAIKEGREKRRRADEKAAAVAAAIASNVAALETKKRAAASTPSSDNGEQMKRQSSPEEKSVIITKGRRHKQRKTERNNKHDASVESEISHEVAASQSSLDSKSVRFAETAKNGNERQKTRVERDRARAENESSSSGGSHATEKRGQQTQQKPSSCLRTKTTYFQSSQNAKTNASDQTPPTSPALNSSVSYLSFSKIHGNGAKKKRHKPRRFQLGYTPHDSSPQHDSSMHSSSPSLSSKSPQKAQVVTLGRSFAYSSRDFDTTPDVADAAQNMGNYRMLIDELSYLCSAILQCKQQQRQSIGIAKSEVICKHNSITAGAAADISELVSQSGTRTALLMLSSSSGRKQQGDYENGAKSVGALGAILEVMACVPPLFDWGDVCKKVIIGAEVKGLKPDRLIVNSNAGGFELDNTNLSAIPVVSLAEKTEFDIIASKALSIVSLFVSIDCTGSSRAAISPRSKIERNVVKGALNSVLQHKQSLQGIARLVSDDPVVNTYLRSFGNVGAHDFNGTNGVDELQVLNNVDDGSIASKSSRGSTLSSLSMSKASSQQTIDEQTKHHAKNADPTKAGRHRSRKRMNLMAIHEDKDEKDSDFAITSSSSKSKSTSPDKSGKYNSLEFHSEGDSAKPKAFLKNVRLNSVEKYTEKLSLALSRAKLPLLDRNEGNLLKTENDTNCEHCKNWGKDILTTSRNVCITSSSLAIDAAVFIITGKDSSSGEDDEAEMHNDDDDSDDDFLGDGNTNNDACSKNPILFANEMLRRSGSLPDYSRAYASTLAAILLAHNSQKSGDQTPCHRCISYLQRRASSLSGVIDSLCCLSPNASIALSCPESCLIPGLLKVVGQLSFGNLVTAATSTRDEILTCLKTLTSLTHENSVACEQLVRPYHWDFSLPMSIENTIAPSDDTIVTGFYIIFSYLLRIVSKKQERPATNYDEDIYKSNERYWYDTTIFCLNTLTNIVEMVPHTAKHLIEHIVVTDEGINAVSWLTRWVVSTTSGFQKSVMKGSFGSDHGDREHSADSDELKAGEEGNLVTAGNGFVLLAYLMLDDDSSSSSSSSIRMAVLKELPIDASGSSGGIQFMMKTLKAFCNFYHYSVGDLSVAVIAPVVKLIAGLQKLDVVEQRKAWL